jgi:hypothetical protein
LRRDRADGAAQRGLAGTDLTGQDKQAFAPANARQQALARAEYVGLS